MAGRVIVLSRDRRLATIAGGLVDYAEALTCLVSPAELPDWVRPPVAAVVLDFPRRSRGIVYRQLRQRYHGWVLALLDPGEVSSGLPPNRGPLAVLHRPFSGEELSTSLGTLLGVPTRNEGAEVPAPPAVPAPPSPPVPAPPGPQAVPERLSAGAAVRTAGAAAAPPTGVSATRTSRYRWLTWQHLDPLTRRRVKEGAVGVGVTALLLIGISLSGGSGCGSTGCTNVAGAIERDGLGGRPPGSVARPLGLRATPPSVQPAASTQGSPTQTTSPPAPGLQFPISSGIGDLIAGTSSSIVGFSGTTSTATTLPPRTATPTTAPPTTAPPTTAPPTTAPPTTAPPTTEPPTTAPPTTEPPTTAPPTTEPPTTAPPST